MSYVILSFFSIVKPLCLWILGFKVRKSVLGALLKRREVEERSTPGIPDGDRTRDVLLPIDPSVRRIKGSLHVTESFSGSNSYFGQEVSVAKFHLITTSDTILQLISTFQIHVLHSSRYDFLSVVGFENTRIHSSKG